MDIPWWLVGVLLSLIASLFGTLGKVLLKLAHNRNDNFVLLAISTLCVIILNPVFDAWSYSYAAQSVLAPMAGFSVVWNIILSPYVLHEKLSRQDIQGSAIILAGCMLVGLSGSHDTPHHSKEEIFQLFHLPVFLGYSMLAILTSIMLVVIIKTFPRISSWRRFAFGALSGIIGGNLFFLKAAVELIDSGNEVWFYTETYIIIVCALASAGGGIFVLNLGLKEYDALYLVALYQSFLIIIGSISGVVFFHEISGMDTLWQEVLYPFSIGITVAGVIVLSKQQLKIDNEEKLPLIYQNSSTRLIVNE